MAPYKPPESVEELLERYAKGERDFHGANPTDANLEGADLEVASLFDAYLEPADLRSGTPEEIDREGVDLEGVDLEGVDLEGVDLRGANLRDANLRDANLRGANLRGANLRDANLSNANLRGVDLIDANLGEASLFDTDLSGANLRGANLSNANLSNANLRGVDLIDVNLGGASLFDTDLSGAKLIGAKLIGTDLIDAKLIGANLIDADLLGARLHNTDLSGADLRGVELSATVLGRVCLIEICKAEPLIVHKGPSIIDFESITMSLLAPNLEDFLVRAGMPHIAAQYMIESARAVKGSVWNMMQSTFISYGSPDEAFARKLYEALHSNGVRTFFFPEHAEPGEKLHRMMRDGVNKHDRVVLICSKASLDRKGVMNEIEESLTREAREGGEAYLIPIRLDDYVFSGWKPPRADIAQAVKDRAVADFTDTMTDQAKFDAAFSKLLRALRVKNTAPTTP